MNTPVFLWKGGNVRSRGQNDAGAEQRKEEEVLGNAEREPGACAAEETERVRGRRGQHPGSGHEGSLSLSCFGHHPLLLLLPPTGSSFVNGLLETQKHCYK